jgi:hypothetical protein
MNPFLLFSRRRPFVQALRPTRGRLARRLREAATKGESLMTDTNKNDIEQLNSFLRGELSAVETYGQCIDKMKDGTVIAQLRGLRDSHARRVELITERILMLGGEPSTGSGVWGSFAKLAEGSAKLFGESAAVSALEEGEDHGRDDYQRDVDKLSPAERAFVESQIMPEQQRTHDALSRIEADV